MNALFYAYDLLYSKLLIKGETTIKITIGQCWISEMEPELGLGFVTALEHRRAHIRFEAGDCERIYAVASAPIKRVVFAVGDHLSLRDGTEFTVDHVDDRDGLLYYSGNGLTTAETDLNPHISFTTPENRLTAGHYDSSYLFNVRKQALYARHELLHSSVHGFVGGRIDLIPHQLYIAHEISSRKIPRALLADEVGLGKTIEACLVLHRLLVTGRINRVLIMVPEVLINQWFVELLRRFNLMFRIIDEDYMLDLEDNQSDENPFENESLVLCSNDFFEYEDERMQQVIKAGWDMLIVDEAHHLKEGTHEYTLVSEVAKQTPGLLLLTATPEQLGLYNHFERLRLLDSARYSDYRSFVNASENYHSTALLSNKILDNQKLTSAEVKHLRSHFTENDKDIDARIKAMQNGDHAARDSIVSDMLDRHGIGRVMFRNTRKAMPDFPKRIVNPVKLNCANDPEFRARLHTEFEGDGRRMRLKMTYDFTQDPRVDWIVQFLTDNQDDKLLLICRTRRKALALHEAIQKKLNVKIALFHEGMSIIQRDRNAAWFSEHDGARMLISSEIGSEGRNFQFAHHLVFVDLPVNPELLEQRIGRLDRIGQTFSIYIHVLYVPNTPYGILFSWYNEGLNAFARHVPGLHQVYERFKTQLWDILKQEKPGNQQIKKMIDESRIYSSEMEAQLEAGRDRLLELHSFQPEIATKVVNEISRHDQSDTLVKLLHKIWDHYGIISEDVDIDNRTFRLVPGDLKIDAFPGFSERGMIVTFDRSKSLEREDVSFLSMDHPMVSGAFDLVLGSELGNSSVAVLYDNKRSGLLVEAIFVLECLAPLHLNIDRFLPPTPVRILLDHKGQNCTDQYKETLVDKRCKSDVGNMDMVSGLQEDFLSGILQKCEELAGKQGEQMIESSQQAAVKVLGGEVDRLLALSKINDHISDDEIKVAREEKKLIEKHIKSARVRLDAIRLIIVGDMDG